MKYKINKGFITQKIDGKVTIFDGEESQLITLNETATYIFGGIKKGFSEKQIVDLMQKKYKVGKNLLRKDVKDTINTLKKVKIII